MNETLPAAFEVRMREQLGQEAPLFFRALSAPPLGGIRLNPMKPSEAVQAFSLTEPVPWVPGAYYLSGGRRPGVNVMHEFGAYYLQEPSAMIPAAALAPLPGERILDLCAAPGGKSTQIGCALKGEGLIVCNEPVPKRAAVLSRNIERMGIPNAVVVNAWPAQLAEQWPEAFDAVLADVPCSGEGMFRREPETRSEWTPERAAGCAARQREILCSAAALVRPGGRLVYSTCTYNPEENERNVQWFLDRFPAFEEEPFDLPGVSAPEGRHTCYPHRMNGEGQFTARFRKRGTGAAAYRTDRSLNKLDAGMKALLKNLFPAFPEATHILGKTLVSMPECPDLQGIRILRAGLHLGEIRGSVFVPDHAAAMAFFPPDIQHTDLSAEEIIRYVSGETVPSETEGWTIVRYRGLRAGWAKGNGGMLKNHYPKGLRQSRMEA